MPKAATPTSPNTAPATQSNTPTWCERQQILCLPRKVTVQHCVSFTKHCASHEKSHSKIMWPSPNTVPATKSDTATSPNTAPATQSDMPTWCELHQILRLPRKVTFQEHVATKCHACHEMVLCENAAPATTFDPMDTLTQPCQCDSSQVQLKNVTKCCTCHEKWHCNFTKYCACHEKWHSKIMWPSPNIAPATKSDIPTACEVHQMLRLPRKNACWRWDRNHLKRSYHWRDDSSMIREWSDHDPTMNPSVRNPPRNRGYLSRLPSAFCIAKYNVSHSGYPSKLHQILRRPRKVTLQLHQILPLPRKVTLQHHVNFTKYCACHEKWASKSMLTRSATPATKW